MDGMEQMRRVGRFQRSASGDNRAEVCGPPGTPELAVTCVSSLLYLLNASPLTTSVFA